MKVYLNEALFGKRFVCFSILVIRIKDFSVIHLIFSLKEEVEFFYLSLKVYMECSKLEAARMVTVVMSKAFVGASRTRRSLCKVELATEAT